MRFSPTVNIKMYGGTLRELGANSLVSDERINQVTLVGAPGITIDRGNAAGFSATLKIDTLTRNIGSTVNFVGTVANTLGTADARIVGGTGTPQLGLSTTAVTPWAYVNNTDWAVYDPTNGVKAIAAYDTWGPSSTTGNVSINAALTVDGSTNYSAIINSLRYNGAATTMTLGTDLTVTSGGILAGATTGTWGIDGSASTPAKQVIAGPGGAAELIINDNNQIDFKARINATGLTKSGAGLLALYSYADAANLNGGEIHLNAGTLQVRGASAIANSGNIVLSGGTLQLLSDTAAAFGNNVSLVNSATINADRVSANNGLQDTLGALDVSYARRLTFTNGNQMSLGFTSTHLGGANYLSLDAGTLYSSYNKWSFGPTSLGGPVWFQINNPATRNSFGALAWDGTVAAGDKHWSKSGTGWMSLDAPAASGYTTSVNLTAGSVRLNADGALGTGSTVNVYAPGVLNFTVGQTSMPTVNVAAYAAVGGAVGSDPAIYNTGAPVTGKINLPASNAIILAGSSIEPTVAQRGTANDWLGVTAMLDGQTTTVDPAHSIYKGVAFGAFSFNDPRSDDMFQGSLASLSGDLNIYISYYQDNNRGWQPLTNTSVQRLDTPTGIVNIYGPNLFRMGANGGTGIQGNFTTINRYGDASTQNSTILNFNWSNNAVMPGKTVAVYNGRVHVDDSAAAVGGTLNVSTNATLVLDGQNPSTGTYIIGPEGAVYSNATARLTSGATFQFMPGSKYIPQAVMDFGSGTWPATLSNADVIMDNTQRIHTRTGGGTVFQLATGTRITTPYSTDGRVNSTIGDAAGAMRILLTASGGTTADATSYAYTTNTPGAPYVTTPFFVPNTVRNLNIDESVSTTTATVQIGDPNLFWTVYQADGGNAGFDRFQVTQNGFVNFNTAGKTMNVAGIDVAAGTFQVGRNAGTVTVNGALGSSGGTAYFNSPVNAASVLVSGGSTTLGHPGSTISGTIAVTGGTLAVTRGQAAYPSAAAQTSAVANKTVNLSGGEFKPMSFDAGFQASYYNGGYNANEVNLDTANSLLLTTPSGIAMWSGAIDTMPSVNGNPRASAVTGGRAAFGDNYQMAFEGYFNPRQANYWFDAPQVDDVFSLYIDLNRNGVFDASDKIFAGGTAAMTAVTGLDPTLSYKMAIAYGENNGNDVFQMRYNTVGNAATMTIVNSSAASQLGMWTRSPSPYSAGPWIDYSSTTLNVTDNSTLTLMGSTSFSSLTLTPGKKLTTNGAGFEAKFATIPVTASGTYSFAGNGTLDMDAVAPFSDGGNAIVLDIQGYGGLKFGNTAGTNVVGNTTFNVNGGRLQVAYAPAGSDSIGGRTVNLSNGGVFSFSSVTGSLPSALTPALNNTGGSFGVELTGSYANTIGTALTNTNAGANISLGSTGPDFTIGGAVSVNGGTVIKSGTGNVILAGTLSGGNVVVNAGTFRLGASNLIEDSRTITVNSGGTFDFGGFADVTSTLHVNPGGVAVTGAGTGPAAPASVELTPGGSVRISSGGTPGTLATANVRYFSGPNFGPSFISNYNPTNAPSLNAGRLDMGAVNGAFNVDDGPSPVELTISAQLAGSAGLTKTGAGRSEPRRHRHLLRSDHRQPGHPGHHPRCGPGRCRQPGHLHRHHPQGPWLLHDAGQHHPLRPWRRRRHHRRQPGFRPDEQHHVPRQQHERHRPAHQGWLGPAVCAEYQHELAQLPDHQQGLGLPAGRWWP